MSSCTEPSSEGRGFDVASVVVHRTVLELHSKTELSHSAKQLKLLETCFETEKQPKKPQKEKNPKLQNIAGSAVSSEPVDVQTSVTGSLILKKNPNPKKHPPEYKTARVRSVVSVNVFRSVSDVFSQQTSCWRHLMFKSSLSCFSCSAERCSSV